MREWTQVHREGTDVGPVDWDHPLAKDMPPIWREAEKAPADFVFGEYNRTILAICMYGGWPYWRPMPAVLFIGPLNSGEWAFFNSYGIGKHSIKRRKTAAAQPLPALNPQERAP